jgi:hypothetical protein
VKIENKALFDDFELLDVGDSLAPILHAKAATTNLLFGRQSFLKTDEVFLYQIWTNLRGFN